jgi:S1-C subfamily serine protease
MRHVESHVAEDPVSSRSGFVRRVLGRRRVIGTLVSFALIGGAVWSRQSQPTRPSAGETAAQINGAVTKAVDKAAKDAANSPARSALVYQAIGPSLVVISTDRRKDVTADGGTADPLVPESTEPLPESSEGIGTGVVINAEGSILTAHHVVAGATKIEVTFADGTVSSAQIISAQPENDIAVLQAETNPEVIVPAVMGGGVNVGDETYAVGHPLGLVGSMSAGVVSGLNRSIPLTEDSSLDGLIQFDAAVNPGNSGGPLLNRNGQVVGIVTALANPSQQGFFVGIGFAVPIGTAGGAAGGPPQ